MVTKKRSKTNLYVCDFRVAFDDTYGPYPCDTKGIAIEKTKKDLKTVLRQLSPEIIKHHTKITCRMATEREIKTYKMTHGLNR